MFLTSSDRPATCGPAARRCILSPSAASVSVLGDCSSLICLLLLGHSWFPPGSPLLGPSAHPPLAFIKAISEQSCPLPVLHLPTQQTSSEHLPWTASSPGPLYATWQTMLSLHKWSLYGAEETDEDWQISKIHICGKCYGEYKRGGEEIAILSQARPHWRDICAKMTIVNFPFRGFPNLDLWLLSWFQPHIGTSKHIISSCIYTPKSSLPHSSSSSPPLPPAPPPVPWWSALPPFTSQMCTQSMNT